MLLRPQHLVSYHYHPLLTRTSARIHNLNRVSVFPLTLTLRLSCLPLCWLALAYSSLHPLPYTYCTRCGDLSTYGYAQYWYPVSLSLCINTAYLQLAVSTVQICKLIVYVSLLYVSLLYMHVQMSIYLSYVG